MKTQELNYSELQEINGGFGVVECVIAVCAVVVACFDAGYELGKDLAQN